MWLNLFGCFLRDKVAVSNSVTDVAGDINLQNDIACEC